LRYRIIKGETKKTPYFLENQEDFVKAAIFVFFELVSLKTGGSTGFFVYSLFVLTFIMVLRILDSDQSIVCSVILILPKNKKKLLWLRYVSYYQIIE